MPYSEKTFDSLLEDSLKIKGLAVNIVEFFLKKNRACIFGNQRPNPF